MKKKVYEIIKITIALVFIYAGFYKLSDIQLFMSQLRESPLIPKITINTLSYLIPIFHLIIGIIIIFLKGNKTFLWLSLGLLIFYTIYLLALYNLFNPPPCSCGGILPNIDYIGQIIFNTVFIMLTSVVIFTDEK